ncbi:hypothetical protein D3C73_1306590 [compost metagenome]
MNVGINTTGSKDITSATMHFCRSSDNHTFGYTILHVRVTRFSDSNNFTILDTDISFHNTPVVNNDYIGNTEV